MTESVPVAVARDRRGDGAVAPIRSTEKTGHSMKASKKAIAFAALFAAAALALSACSGGSLSGGSGGDSGSGGGKWKGISVGKSGEQSQIQDISKFCGTKKIKVAYADGSGNNAWRQITKILFENEAKKCKNITKVEYTDAQNNTAKAISDFNSLVAQGYNVIVTFADSGEALLPTIKKATAAGVEVIPIVSGVGGTPGKDYVDFVSEDVKTYGYNLAVWTMDHMKDKSGNLVMLGGTAGNQYSATVYSGVQDALK